MATQTEARTADRSIAWRLGVRTHKGVLLLHMLAAGTWFDLDVAMAVLVFTAVAADDPSTKVYCYRALELFAVWPLFAAVVIFRVSDSTVIETQAVQGKATFPYVPGLLTFREAPMVLECGARRTRAVHESRRLEAE